MATILDNSAADAHVYPSLFPKTEDPQEVTYADLNMKAPSEAASVPAEEPPGSCECATLTA